MKKTLQLPAPGLAVLAGARSDMAVSTHDQIPPLHDIVIRLRVDGGIY